MMTFRVYYTVTDSRGQYPRYMYAGKLHVAEHGHLYISHNDHRIAGSTSAIDAVKSMPGLQLRRIDTPAHMQRKLY